MSILNIIASNWSFEERERLNQNWSIIENYLSNLQGQIRILSGDEDVTEIIDRLNNALTQGESTLEELQTALIDATTVINNAQTATDNANDAAQGALNAITDIQNIINDFGSKGEYDNNVSYKRNNIVYKDGCSYIYINEVASSGNTPPPYPTISNAHWHMLADKGASGSGAVSKVNGKDPNGSGEIILTPNDIGAASNENLIQLQGQVTTHLDNFVNVKAYGAVGDGLTDDTHAFESAINRQQLTGGVLIIPSGIYIVSKGFHILNSIRIIGVNQPTIKASNTFNTDTLGIIRIDGDNSSIEGVTINGNKENLSNSNFGIVLYKASYIRFRNVNCINTTGIGMGFSNCRNVLIKDCKVEYAGNNGSGFWADADLGGDYLKSNLTFDNCVAQYNDLDGFLINTNNVKLLNCTANNNGLGSNLSGALGAAGIYSDKVLLNITIENCTCNGNTEFGINMGLSQSKIIGCTCNTNALSGINLGKDSTRTQILACTTEGNGTSDTTDNPSVWGKSGIQFGGVTFCVITNCISYNNKSYGIEHLSTFASDGVIVTSNNLKYNATDDANIGSGYPTSNVTNLIMANNY